MWEIRSGARGSWYVHAQNRKIDTSCLFCLVWDVVHLRTPFSIVYCSFDIPCLTTKYHTHTHTHTSRTHTHTSHITHITHTQRVTREVGPGDDQGMIKTAGT
jgi:hypothetical protein